MEEYQKIQKFSENVKFVEIKIFSSPFSHHHPHNHHSFTFHLLSLTKEIFQVKMGYVGFYMKIEFEKFSTSDDEKNVKCSNLS